MRVTKRRVTLTFFPVPPSDLFITPEQLRRAIYVKASDSPPTYYVYDWEPDGTGSLICTKDFSKFRKVADAFVVDDSVPLHVRFAMREYARYFKKLLITDLDSQLSMCKLIV